MSTQQENLLTESGFVDLQLREALETFRSQFNLAIQILTAFVIADVTVIGFAVSAQIAGVILIGAIVPLIMMIVIAGVERFMRPVLYTVVVLETRYGVGYSDWLASTFLSVVISPDVVEQLKSISRLEEFSDRMEELRRRKLELINRRGFRITLATFAVLHIAISILLSAVFRWKFL